MKHAKFFDTSALRAELAEALRLAKCWNREGGTQACRFLSTSWDFLGSGGAYCELDRDEKVTLVHEPRSVRKEPKEDCNRRR